MHIVLYLYINETFSTEKRLLPQIGSAPAARRNSEK